MSKTLDENQTEFTPFSIQQGSQPVFTSLFANWKPFAFRYLSKLQTDRPNILSQTINYVQIHSFQKRGKKEKAKMRRGFRPTCSSFTTQFSVLRYDRVGIKNLTFFFYYDFHPAITKLSSAVPSKSAFLYSVHFILAIFARFIKKDLFQIRVCIIH